MYLVRRKRILYKILWGKRPHRRHRCRWKDNVKIDLHKVGFVGIDWNMSGSG